MRELTIIPLIVGTLLGVIFGASSLYLVLKVGLTVSASIPVAVISITLFRLFSKFGMRDATILENNIVQTAGSAGESIAFGLGVTMPAIMILGFDLEITRVMLVAVLGGLLGILMMIPLRRALIVDQHGILKYPEGTACAEVLKAAASREGMDAAAGVEDEATGGGKIIFSGFGIGFIYQAAMNAFKWLEKYAGEDFRRAVQGGVDLGHDRAGAARGRLHHWAADCFDYVRGWRARLSGAHPGNQVFRRKRDGHHPARDDANQPDGSGRYSRRLCSLHWRGRGGGGRHHQPLSFAPDDLAWTARAAWRI